jgi:hypothetical protein
MSFRNDRDTFEDHVLAELRAVREQLAFLVSELRGRKRRTARRARTLALHATAAVGDQLGGHAPTPWEVARARRCLMKRR